MVTPMIPNGHSLILECTQRMMRQAVAEKGSLPRVNPGNGHGNASDAQETMEQPTDCRHEGKVPEVDGSGGHGNVEEIVGDDRGQPNEQQQLPPLQLHCLVHHIPVPPPAPQKSCHPVPQQMPAASPTSNISHGFILPILLTLTFLYVSLVTSSSLFAPSPAFSLCE